MALFHVSHPPWLRPVGVGTSSIHFSNISWTPRVLDPITNPFLGPSSWLHPASKGLLLAGHKKVPHDFRLRTGDHSDTADYAGNLKRPAQRSMDDWEEMGEELQTSVFLLFFSWQVVLLTGILWAWPDLAKGRGQDYVFVVVSSFLKRVRFNGRIPPFI